MFNLEIDQNFSEEFTPGLLHRLLSHVAVSDHKGLR